MTDTWFIIGADLKAVKPAVNRQNSLCLPNADGGSIFRIKSENNLKILSALNTSLKLHQPRHTNADAWRCAVNSLMSKIEGFHLPKPVMHIPPIFLPNPSHHEAFMNPSWHAWKYGSWGFYPRNNICTAFVRRPYQYLVISPRTSPIGHSSRTFL